MILYVIQVHKPDANLELLIALLRHPAVRFLVFVDGPPEWVLPESERPTDVQIFRSTPVTWGGYSQVRAMRQQILKALADDFDWTYLVNLSGADIPLKSAQTIVDELAVSNSNEVDAYLNIYDNSPAFHDFDIWERECRPRSSEVQDIMYNGRVKIRASHDALKLMYDSRYDPVMNYKTRPLFHCYNSMIEKVMIVAEPSEIEKKHRTDFRNKFGLYSGRSWFILSRRFASLMVQDAFHDELLRYLENILCCDEAYLQTWVQNRAQALGLNVVDSNRRYMEAAPSDLTDSDLPALQASDALFARKFSIAQAPAIHQWLLAGLSAPPPPAVFVPAALA